MDIDISDILASVSRPAPQPQHQQHPQTTSTRQPPSRQPSYLPDTTTHTDHQLLTRAWTSERCSPELLPYPAQLLERVMESVRGQIARIEELAGGDGTSFSTIHGGGGEAGQGGANVNLVLSILQTDLSRTQFLVRSLLRVRLGKVGAWAGYYSHLADTDMDEKPPAMGEAGATTTKTVAGGLLSQTEAHFLRKQQALLTDFYSNSFLSGFPAKMRRLDDGGTGEGGMLEGPGREGVVVVRCLGEGGWGNREELERGNGEGGVVNELRFRRGEVWVVRWGDVRGGVLEGALELL